MIISCVASITLDHNMLLPILYFITCYIIFSFYIIFRIGFCIVLKLTFNTNYICDLWFWATLGYIYGFGLLRPPVVDNRDIRQDTQLKVYKAVVYFLVKLPDNDISPSHTIRNFRVVFDRDFCVHKSVICLYQLLKQYQ